jgi:hypothetical protein
LDDKALDQLAALDIFPTLFCAVIIFDPRDVLSLTCSVCQGLERETTTLRSQVETLMFLSNYDAKIKMLRIVRFVIGFHATFFQSR